MDDEALDLSDVHRWLGRSLGGEQLREPVSITDVRRWVQAMQNPNPVHFDEPFARQSSFGAVVAPQSFVVACAVRHGITPSIQGTIHGSHQLNVGDEWWFSEPRVEIGEHVVSKRTALDVRTTTTKFAGPTAFQRGDTTYVNLDGKVLARQRSTAMRYLVSNLRSKSGSASPTTIRSWSGVELEEIERERLAYASQVRAVEQRGAAGLALGEQLPRRPLGPHSIQSFTTEQRAYLYTVWGNLVDDGLGGTGRDFGGVEAMTTRTDAAAQDPTFADGLLHGGGRGHTDQQYAAVIGMEKPFGYGASMTAYVLDYVSNWFGFGAMILHSSLRYRTPVYLGDMTYVSARVQDVANADRDESSVVALEISMVNQDDDELAQGLVTVRCSR